MAEERRFRASAPLTLSPENSQPRAIARHLIVVCVFLFAFGFPGKLADLFGGSKVSMLLQYALFALQIAFMLLSSSEDLINVKLVDLKKEFTPIYLLLAVTWITSLLVTHDYPSQIIACLRYTVTAMFALWIIQWYDVKHILRLAFTAQSILVLLCVMYTLLFPDQAYGFANGERRFVAIFTAKNVFGSELAFGLTLQVALLRIYWEDGQQPSIFFYLMMALQIMLLVLTHAVGSLISAALPIAYLMLSRGFKGWLRRLPIGVFYILGSIGFLFFALNMMDMVAPLLEAFGKDATLTGRIPMWEQHISNMLESHTYTGYGFGMFWENQSALKAYHAAFERHSWAGTMTLGAHNELIELWLDTGLIGVAAYLFMIFCAFRRTDKISEAAYVFCVTVMMGAFIKGLTERLHSTASYWTLFIFLSCGVALKSRAEASVPAPHLRS